MRLNSLANRYCQAVYASAEKKGTAETVRDDLLLVQSAVAENENLRKTLMSPIINAEKKKSLAKALFADKINPLTLDFLCLVIDKNRENVLSLAGEEYEKIFNEANSVNTLIIESVIYLSEEKKSLIREKMEKKLNVRLKVRNILNRDLIGGVRLYVGDSVTDGSVKNRLKEIEESLSQ